MSQECGFPISYPKPTTINPCCDNVTLLLEHLKAILDLIWLTDQGETSPSLVASLGGNLCEELERRIKVFSEMARIRRHGSPSFFLALGCALGVLPLSAAPPRTL